MPEAEKETGAEAIDFETWKKLGAVKSNLWTGSLAGLVVGALAGKAFHDLAHYFSKNKKKQFNKNTLVLTMISSAAVCSYLGSVVNGKQSFVREMFYEGRPALQRPPVTSAVQDDDLNPKISTYQAKILQNQREVVTSFDDAFHRRAEAIRRKKEQDAASGQRSS
jgi:hypothetical protein